MTPAPMRIAMVAGEPSGDVLASAVLRALPRHAPDARVFGIGGPRMQACGFRSDHPMATLSVNGYWDALKHLREIKAIRDTLRDALIADPPAVFVGVDAPDFNLGLERRLKAAGVRTVHFVSPSIWAWRGGRIRAIARAVDRMLCVFPFEPELYARAGIDAVYVGHPLADEIPVQPDPAAARARLGLDGARRVIAVLPGSRRGEIEHIGPIFAATVERMHQRDDTLTFVVPAATPALRASLDAQFASARTWGARIVVLDGRSHDAIEASDAVLVASGTATLECALYKKPMVIAYKVAWLSAAIMRRMGYLPYVGLPNILAGEFVVPEFLQERAQPLPIADAMFDALDDADRRAALVERFTQMHHTLRCGTGDRAAAAIAAMASSAR